LIEEQEIPAEFVAATVTSYAEQRLQQINQRIMSTTRLLEIIDRFDLYKKIRRKRTTEEVVKQMRDDVKLGQISAEVIDRRTGRPTSATIAFSLSYQGKDRPEVIQKVANVLVSLFLEENLQVRSRQTAETSKFFQDEMKRVQEKLAEFKERHMHELPELLELNIQQLGNTESRMERLEEQLRSQQNQEGYLRTQLANLSPFLEDADRNRLKMLETELATLRSSLSDIHPGVIKTANAVKALRRKLANKGINTFSEPEEPDNPAYITLASQLASTKSEIYSIRNQLQDLRKTKAKYEARIETTPKVEHEYRRLTRDQANLKVKSDDLMQKYMEATVAHGLEKEQKGERFTLIDPPRIPEKPFKPNRVAIVMIGVVLGIAAGFGLAALREFSDQSVYRTDKLAAAGLPVLGEVPSILLPRDVRRIRMRRVLLYTAACLLIIGAVTAFHFYVMDLYVFWAKIDRRLAF
jgi:polysaccharide chain length determinant protein (PEP-CTERM system associated)